MDVTEGWHTIKFISEYSNYFQGYRSAKNGRKFTPVHFQKPNAHFIDEKRP